MPRPFATFQAWLDCFVLNGETCLTAACSNEIDDLTAFTTSCADGVVESCQAYTCCAACADLGRTAINCAAVQAGCPQRCSNSTRRATGGVLTAFFLTMTILGSVVLFVVD
jgi:hypothetical protein